MTHPIAYDVAFAVVVVLLANAAGFLGVCLLGLLGG